MNKTSIKRHLSKDKTLAPLVQQIDFPEIKLNEDLYGSLISAIISQQLSVKAANTIHNRFLELFKGSIPTFKALLNTNHETLRGVGLSGQKAGYLKNIAQFGIDQTLAYNDLKNLDDETLIAHLTQIKGVGKWTVEMILMFNLNRLDVFPIDDLGIQNAIKKLYDLETTGRELKAQMITQANTWKPYRSIACKYLWRWKDLKKN